MLFDNRILKRWSDVLPLVQRIMMAEPNEVIGVSPAQLLFGNSIQLDRWIFLPNLPKEGVEAEIVLSDWSDKMFEAQRILLDTAQRLQQQNDARHMEATTGVTTRFEVGSYALISYNPQIKDECKTAYEIASTIEGTVVSGKVTSNIVRT